MADLRRIADGGGTTGAAGVNRGGAVNACLGFVTVLVVLAAGCTSSDHSHAADMDAFVGLICCGSNIDYAPHASPHDLAASSDLIVDGTVDRVQEGRLWGDERESALRTVVLVVQVDTVYKGTVPHGADGRVYVELTAIQDTPAQAYDRVAPRDARVLVYLVHDPKAAPGNPPFVDADAGRPSGHPLWEAAPQGLVVATADGSVVYANGFPSARGTDLSDFLPDKEHWPSDR